ncbi:hypothetical protein LFM09_08215 [Lentzea alba]|uniref:lanthionine synthetase LanC family protein n=1 Tax=Lentzea alba TaxID=2714351 RepID=UPI0039BF608C
MGTYWGTAESAWRWVLDQVRYDDEVWIPDAVGEELNPRYHYGMYSGVAGLAHVLAEIRLCRAWTDEEQRLADVLAAQVRAGIGKVTDCSFFGGLPSAIGVLTALDAPGREEAVARTLELSTPDGWAVDFLTADHYLPGARVHDLGLGTAGVLLAAVWARRHGVAGAGELAEVAAGVLLAEREEVPVGANWRWIPERFTTNGYQMPNFSHGLSGIATALALAGAEFDRPDLVKAAAEGAEHLVTLADLSDGGFRVWPRLPLDENPFSYGWCHGPTGTSLLWPALRHAGVSEVGGRDVMDWHRRCLHSIRVSGLPERLYPGFWDNDGRCCGTAGVGDVLLDCGQDLDFALHLADVVVSRASPDGAGVCWRFIEHQNEDPLLPPGIGWMQGAAGIAAFLFHAGRPDSAVARMDNWWVL